MLGLKLNHVSKRGPKSVPEPVITLSSLPNVCTPRRQVMMLNSNCFSMLYKFECYSRISDFDMYGSNQPIRISDYYARIGSVPYLVGQSFQVNIIHVHVYCVCSLNFPRWRHQMEIFSALLAPLCGKSTGHWWIPITKASDAKLWRFLWSPPKQSKRRWLEKQLGSLWRHFYSRWLTVTPSTISFWWTGT